MYNLYGILCTVMKLSVLQLYRVVQALLYSVTIYTGIHFNVMKLHSVIENITLEGSPVLLLKSVLQ